MDLSKIIIKINAVALWRLFRKYILRKKPVRHINFGLVRDKKDSRDLYFKIKTPLTALPEKCTRIFDTYNIRYNQFNLGSCVANAVVSCCQVSQLTRNQQLQLFSRLFVYYNLRTDENKGVDSGGSIRDGIKAVNKYGACREFTWPYDVKKFATEPPRIAYEEGEKHQALMYERIYPVTREAIMDAIYRGYAVVYGKALHESFMSEQTARTGIIPKPKSKCVDPVVGYHAMMIGGYEKDFTLELNSWGDDWGMNGLCEVPWDIVLNPKEAFDFWAITLMEEGV